MALHFGNGNNKMKIYLAGKIASNDWRHDIVDNLRNINNDDWDLENRIIPKAIFNKHDYIGPFFIGCDHSCYHGKTRHGVGAGNKRDRNCGYKPNVKRDLTLNLCLKAINNSDLIFCWMPEKIALQSYGTLIEIGHANAIGRPVIIASDKKLDQELWFAEHISECFIINKDPAKALKQGIALLNEQRIRNEI